MAGAHPKEIDVAFAGNHELRKRVHAAIGKQFKTISPFSYLRAALICFATRPKPQTEHSLSRHLDIHLESELTSHGRAYVEEKKT